MYGRMKSWVGEFTVGDKMIVTDPCYDRAQSTIRTSLQAILNTKPGKWEAEVEIVDEGSWGKRVAELRARTGFTSYHSHDWTWVANCGVDSGQLGFFDHVLYPEDPGEYGDGSWYDRVCDKTHDRSGKEHRYAGIMEGMGVVSTSGFGDGGYDVYVAENDKGQVVAVKVVFIDDDEEEEEDY